MRLTAALALGAALALAGCASAPPPGLQFDTSLSAKGQDSRVQYLVLHYTVEDLQGSIRILTQQEVSAHYLVTDELPPRIYHLVDESRLARHAGLSSWRGQTQLNASSIGIEIVNPGYLKLGDGSLYWPPYGDAQMDLVIELVKDVVKRHQIRPERVVGHSDIAPQRKSDPGPRFPWKRLADLGLIPWPDATRVAEQRALFDAQLPDVAWFQRALATHGFEVPRHGQLDTPTRNVLRAFQMKYRPEKFDGEPDAETAAMLQVLTTPAVRR